MFGSTSPFGQSSNSPFGSPSVFGQTSNANHNPFAPKPYGSSTTPTPFGASQTGTSIFGGTSTGVFGAPAAAQSSSPFSSAPAFGASSAPAFGASSAPAFGSSSSSFGGSSVFGQKPVFGAFGSTPSQTSPFGSTAQPSQPAFGSSLFGSSTPFGASSQPAFGATSTPAFSATSAPAFGATSAPAFGATSGPAFGATSAPAFGATSAPAPAFGATSAPAFNATSAHAFGATSAPAFGSTSSPAFGNTGSAYGVSSTPLFGSGGAFGASSGPAFGASSTPSFSFTSSPAFGQSTSAFGSSPFGTSTSPFGAQSSGFGAQSTTPFGNTGFGQSAFGGQRGGSRVAPYSPTPEPDNSSSGTGAAAGKLESISAMPVYKDKSHEELRWEDYQLGDKGGSTPTAQSTGIFSSSTSQPSVLGPSPSFTQSSSSLFSNTTSSNLFAPKPPVFSSTGFGPMLGSSPSLFTSTASTPSLFGTTSSPFTSNSSPSPFASSSPGFGPPSAFTSNVPTSAPTFSTSLFNSTASPIAQTSSGFGQSTSAFGPSTTSSFTQSILFSTPSSGFANTFSSTPSLTPPTNPFAQTAPSFPSPFSAVQPAQTTSSLGFSAFPQPQPANTTGGAMGLFGNLPATQSPAVVQPVPASNPFGTLPAMPQMSIGRGGTAPSVQYGISSMPVLDKAAPVRISPLLTSRHLSQRRIRLPARKYDPKSDGAKVPFFSDDEETASTPKADALFLPRENPRSLVIRPAEQWPLKFSADKAFQFKDTSPIHENGKSSEDVHPAAPVFGGGGFNSEDKDKDSREDGLVQEKVNLVKVNQKSNEVHDDHTIQKGDSYMTLSGHRAGEAAIVYEHGADIEALMPKLRRSDYYTEPRIQELAAKERAEPGFCRHVKNFVVGRHGYGSIKFFGETDVRRLDLESLVQFNNREVIVYMDDSKKPPVGQGLNKPAEVTLLNIKCFDKKTGRQYTEGPKIEKYKDMLKRKAEDQGAEFVSYDPVKGEWKFRVNHFSEYKLREEDEDGFDVHDDTA
ncbi:Nuclear pore complex protein [Morus notabilis]|uniref:Nucleoporin autopeptidase n=1 Tax=Morus notabilis TaxID=981085 RepID=W9SV07_9ROSA|nr:nuclear pore complex protein NUP98A isoform X2 [Morus notabilis]EXC28321.1 Nuclear pore complex protein [Morus notabilis]